MILLQSTGNNDTDHCEGPSQSVLSYLSVISTTSPPIDGKKSSRQKGYFGWPKHAQTEEEKSDKTLTSIVKQQPDRHKKQSVSPILLSSSNQKDKSLRKNLNTLPISIEQPNCDSTTNLLPSPSSKSSRRDNLSPPNSRKNDENKDGEGEEKEKEPVSLSKMQSDCDSSTNLASPKTEKRKGQQIYPSVLLSTSLEKTTTEPIVPPPSSLLQNDKELEQNLPSSEDEELPICTDFLPSSPFSTTSESHLEPLSPVDGTSISKDKAEIFEAGKSDPSTNCQQEQQCKTVVILASSPKVAENNQNLQELIKDPTSRIDVSEDIQITGNEEEENEIPPRTPPHSEGGSSKMMDIVSPMTPMPQLLSPLPMTPYRAPHSSPAPVPVALQGQYEILVPMTPRRPLDSSPPPGLQSQWDAPMTPRRPLDSSPSQATTALQGQYYATMTTPKRPLDSSPAAGPPVPGVAAVQDQEQPAVPALTPAREDDEDAWFVKPSSSTFGTPRRTATPMQFQPLPPLLSPLPATPYRNRDSERSVNIESDLELTESEMSDVESTPRYRSTTQHHASSSELDMPKLSDPPGSYSRPPKHAYSKDLSKLSSHQKSRENTLSDSTVSATLSPNKIPPVMLRRQSGNEWNVQSSDEEPGKKRDKLDKVVLKIKKSVGGYNCNLTKEKSLDESISSSLEPSMAQDHLCGLLTGTGEERRGRRTRKATYGDNLKELVVQSKPSAENESALAGADLNDEKTPVEQETEVQNKSVLLQINDKSREPKRKTSSSPPPPSPSPSIEAVPPSPTPKTEFAKPKKVGPKTFSRKNRTDHHRAKSLGKPLMEKKGMIKVKPSENTSSAFFDKEIQDLCSKVANENKQNEGYNELSHLMQKSLSGSVSQEIEIDFNVGKQIQNKLSIENSEESEEKSKGMSFFVSSSKASIDLPMEENQISVCNSDAEIPVYLNSNSDGITSDVLKNKEPEPQLTVQPKKKGRPAHR